LPIYLPPRCGFLYRILIKEREWKYEDYNGHDNNILSIFGYIEKENIIKKAMNFNWLFEILITRLLISYLMFSYLERFFNRNHVQFE